MADVANFALFARALCEMAEIASFAVCFLEFSGWTPSLLVVVRIQRISRDSRKLWANCAKFG